MSKFALSVFFAAALVLSQGAIARSNAAAVKVADDFQSKAAALSTSAANLVSMQADASPHDGELLALINSQMALVGVNVDGIVALSQLTAQMRDSRDLKLTRKYLAAHCDVLRQVTDPTVTYVKSVAYGVAAVAINAELEKITELAGDLEQHAVCTDKSFNPLARGV